MRPVIGFLVSAAILIGIAFGIAAIPGSVGGVVGDIHFDAPAPIAVTLGLALFIVLYLFVRLAATILHLPGRFGQRAELRRRRAGDRALTGALLALAAGEAGDARREANRARRLLGPTPQTLLLAAEADRASGRLDEAEATYEMLAARHDAAFLGLRGLIRLSVDRADYGRARELVTQAERTRPDTAWVRNERLALAVRTENWREALSSARDDAERAAFATAAAEAETDDGQALKLAKQAHKLAPDLAPAAIAYARRLHGDWNERRALAVLRDTWRRAPHPSLADAAMSDQPDPLQRVKIAADLVAKDPETLEAHLLMGRTSLEAGMVGEARRHAETALRMAGPQRRILALLADIVERDPALSEPERRAAHMEALRALASALPDPVWRCTHCATEHAAWSPTCPSCLAPGRLAWATRPSTALVPVGPPHGSTITAEPVPFDTPAEGVGRLVP